MTTATQQSARSGFGNLLARENRLWWGGARWLVQLLIGLVGLGGFTAFSLFVLPAMAEAAGEPLDGLDAAVQIFFGLGLLAYAIDVIILTQDAIIGEKQSGVAEWVLSKPVSRAAYLLSKLLANGLGILLILILLPGAAVYGFFTLATGGAYPAGAFFGALGLMALHTLFYLAFSVLMGVLTDSRGVLLGVTLASVLGGSMVVNFLGPIAFATPWPLGNIAVGLALGAPLPAIAWLPVGATLALTAIAVGLALVTFRRAEL